MPSMVISKVKTLVQIRGWYQLNSTTCLRRHYEVNSWERIYAERCCQLVGEGGGWQIRLVAEVQLQEGGLCGIRQLCLNSHLIGVA